MDHFHSSSEDSNLVELLTAADILFEFWEIGGSQELELSLMIDALDEMNFNQTQVSGTIYYPVRRIKAQESPSFEII
jgi:hypothetical protein